MDGTKYYNANFVFDKQKEMECILFDEGRIVNDNGNFMYEYHLKDHLGSVRVAFVPTTSGTEIVQENAYYPFGGTIDDFSYNASENRYKHTGMEAINDFGLNMLDNNARWRDVSEVPRFYGIDPLAEKYYSISPYAYCENNPLKYIDPDGRDVVITGALSDEALKQLQDKVGKYMTLSMNESGSVRYSMNEGVKKLKGDAKRMAGMIDNSSITVNLITTDKNETSTGNLFTGGAFMGNTVTTDANGNVTVSAHQEVNPNVLGAADTHTNTPGKMMMHEATEAYEGAKISQKAGVSSPRSGMPGSVYEKAHNKATSQTTVYETIYDKAGNKLQMLPGGAYPPNTTKAEWHVTKNGKSKIIQTYP